MTNGKTKKALMEWTGTVEHDMIDIKTMDATAFARRHGLSKLLHLQMLSDQIGLVKLTMDGMMHDGVLSQEMYTDIMSHVQVVQKDIDEWASRVRQGDAQKGAGHKNRGRRG